MPLRPLARRRVTPELALPPAHGPPAIPHYDTALTPFKPSARYIPHRQPGSTSGSRLSSMALSAVLRTTDKILFIIVSNKL